MAANTTKPTEVTVDDFLATVPKPERQADGRTLRAVFERVSGEPARMWGPSIIGCGTTRYRYDSGREGEICSIGFSPRASALVLYLGGLGEEAALLARLGKHRLGKGCLYVTRLADVDLPVLEALVAASLARQRASDVTP